MTKKMKESAVIILQLRETGKILFLLRPEGWCLPGGKLEDGETIIGCASRELEEETGKKIPESISNFKFLGISQSVSGRKVHVFLARTGNSAVRISTEHTNYKWVKWSDIGQIELAGNTKNFLELLKLV